MERSIATSSHSHVELNLLVKMVDPNRLQHDFLRTMIESVEQGDAHRIKMYSQELTNLAKIFELTSPHLAIRCHERVMIARTILAQMERGARVQ